jgi:hypothetical protein
MADPVVEHFALPPDAVFGAAQAVAGEMGKSVDQVDPVNRTLYFNTGMSMWSWNGQNVTAAVTDDGSGGSQLHVEPQLKKSGLSSFQLVSWGEGPRVAKKFAKRVRDRLGAPAPGVSSPG